MASPNDGPEAQVWPMCCVRCGTVVLPAPRSGGPSANDQALPSAPPVDLDETLPKEVNPLAAFDTWELDEQLRHVERILSGPRFNVPPAAGRDELRIDMPGPMPAVHPATKSDGRSSQSPRPRGGKPFAAFMAWTGLAVFTCGAALIGWSLFERREDLWDIGPPTALAGLLMSLIGLLLQVDLAWHAHDVLSDDLAQVERQVGELAQRSTLPRGASPTQASSSLAEERRD